MPGAESLRAEVEEEEEEGLGSSFNQLHTNIMIFLVIYGLC